VSDPPRRADCDTLVTQSIYLIDLGASVKNSTRLFLDRLPAQSWGGRPVSAAAFS
jgi:hypothetical protein